MRLLLAVQRCKFVDFGCRTCSPVAALPIEIVYGLGQANRHAAAGSASSRSRKACSCSQFVLCQPALGDVVSDAEHANWPAGVIALDRTLGRDPAHAIVGQRDAELTAIGVGCANGRFELGQTRSRSSGWTVLAEVATSANCTRSGVSTNRATGPAVCTVLRIKSTFHATTLAASRICAAGPRHRRAPLHAGAARRTARPAPARTAWPPSCRSGQQARDRQTGRLSLCLVHADLLF